LRKNFRKNIGVFFSERHRKSWESGKLSFSAALSENLRKFMRYIPPKAVLQFCENDVEGGADGLFGV